MKDTILVPKQLGWFGLERDEKDFPDPNDRFEMEWVDNIHHLTADQALQLCDVVTRETIEVHKIMSDDEFDKYKKTVLKPFDV